MILSGDKKEEYREIKEYWKTRLVEYISNHSHLYNQPHLKHGYNIEFKPFDKVVFRNGYSKIAREMTVDLKYITVDMGQIEWGAQYRKYYFVLHLGDILETKYCLPLNCEKTNTDVCDDCEYKNFEKVGHPGGSSYHCTEWYFCEQGFWEDNF